MKTLPALAVGATALFKSGISLAQNGHMMNGGGMSGGWMGGYGWGWGMGCMLLVIAGIALVAWIITRGRQ
ncbi:hypothetical protein [Actimicrobium antarcticum]|uniref:Uncharacterized protein n=1 Tax=Actimicrobium antarcticum TaxID=1051899 RepID=A0ABP7TS30_9BURK